MKQEEQAKQASPVKTDAIAKKDRATPAKPADELSEQDLAGVAGGSTSVNTTRSNIKHQG